MAEVEGKERRILVAVDESEESMYALKWCLQNVASDDTQNTLILLYARPPPPVYPALDGTGYLFSSDIIATMDKYSKDLADSVMQKAKAISGDFHNIKVEEKVERGDPRDVICETAMKLGVDMVAMGSHGYGFLKRALLGSVSEHCIKNVKCPILVVKRPKQ